MEFSNERFVNGAPAAVVEKERKKKADAEAKIAVIEQQLAGLRKWLFNYKYKRASLFVGEARLFCHFHRKSIDKLRNYAIFLICTDYR